MSGNSYIVTFKAEASDSEIQKAKNDITSKGGSIDHEYTLIRGFSCTLPKDHVSTLESHPHVESVEKDQVMKTQ